MNKRMGCGSQLLGAVVLLVLIYWGIDSCVQRGIERQHKAGDILPESRPGTPSIEIVKVRLVPFTTPQGLRTQMVRVDWKNTGTTTVRAVDADIIPYDARGNTLESGARDYAIYAVSDSSPGIAPGESYSEPNGQGFILSPSFGEAATVKVKITEVLESGAY